MIVIAIGLVAFAISFVYSSFFEWVLHKYIMHMDKFLKYPFRAHQLEHHEIYKADATYFIQDDEGLKHISFAWWNAPLLFLVNWPAFVVIGFLGGWTAQAMGSSMALGSWVAGSSALISMISYYLLYEYLHYCMHIPTGRALEKSKIFQFVQTHHRLHHVYYMKNLNVVVPIADFILGTRVGMPRPDLFEMLEDVRQRRLEKVAHAEEEAEEELEAVGAGRDYLDR